MRPFTYEKAGDLAQASRMGAQTGQGQADAPTQYLAGGTTLIDLMKLDVLRPVRLVDLGGLRDHQNISLDASGLRLGAFCTMSRVADHPQVRAHYPVLADSLQLAASAQLRNMATLGGNVLQKTRCSYYRDPSWTACNKRAPGSGCAAITGFNRNHAVLGVDQSCISQYPGDFAIALMALDAEVEISGPRGMRRIAIDSLHLPPSGQPHVENTLGAGEAIVAFHIAATPWSWRSVYVKVRDRSSYQFAIASAAVALDLEGDVVRQVRIGLGGMAYRPWRAKEAEGLLTGKALTEANANAASEAALQGAKMQTHNHYKPWLARETIVRALLQAQSLSKPAGVHNAG